MARWPHAGEGGPSRSWWAVHRVEVRYGLLGVVLIGGIWALDAIGALAAVAGWLDPAVEALAGLGVVGAFLLGLLGNSSLMLQVPYTVPMLSAALAGAPLPYLLALGAAAGLGATVGELVSYTIADQLLRRSPDLSSGRLYRWVERTVRAHPRAIPWLVLGFGATLLPDDTVLIPLAMIRYGAGRLLLPLLLGKLTYCLGSAWVFHVAGDRAARWLSPEVTTDLAIVGVVAFLLVIFYQAARARQSRALREPGDGITEGRRPS